MAPELVCESDDEAGLAGARRRRRRRVRHAAAQMGLGPMPTPQLSQEVMAAIETEVGADPLFAEAEVADRHVDAADCGRPLIGPCGCLGRPCQAHRHWWDFRATVQNRGSSSTGPRPAPEGGAPPARAWQWLRELDLEATLKQQVVTLREPPRWLRGQLRAAFNLAMRERVRHREAAWKLFVLVPRMLLRKTLENGEEGKREFAARMRRFS